MSWKGYHSAFFIGIGGIGMSAIARYFNTVGVKVCGYDKTPTPLTSQLQNEGIEVHFSDDISLIPKAFNTLSNNNIVVYTPAIPASHAQLNHLRDLGYQLFKRSEVLGIITEGCFTIAVAGTHGKTTTSTLLAHLLKEQNRTFTAFLGGISTNYNSNYIQHDGSGEPVMLVEADEYDRSFLRLFPSIAVVTSADADHLDIYGDKDHLSTGFKLFIKNIKENGSLVIHEGLDLTDEQTTCNILEYGINRGQFFASNITINDGFFVYDLYAENSLLKKLLLGVPGFYNIENAVAATAVMNLLGYHPETLRKSLASFSGVKRRFEFVLKQDNIVLIDDYAHHPKEIEAFLTSLKELYASRKVTVIFQPHLYSRTRDFALGFSESLSIADRVLLLDIYPARELPIEGVQSSMLLDDITCSEKQVCSKSYVLNEFTPAEGEVVAIVGAGDIDQLVQPLKEKWKHERVA